MTTTVLGQTDMKCSRLAYGCWRIADSWNLEGASNADESGARAIRVAYDAGYTLFDHADIYCDGLSETLFGRVLRDTPGMRDQILIASKCGIVKPNALQPQTFYRYNFTKDHIVRSCEQSLQRLGVETIDLYQLHRPDYLMDPAEVAAAFTELKQSGKARFFGVSNFRPSQLSALQAAGPPSLCVNQIEMSLARLSPWEDGTLDQCLALGVTPMAWSPLAGGKLADGARRLLPPQEAYETKATIAQLDELAPSYGATRSTLALAWLLRHPAGIIPIVGSIQPDRIRHAAQAVQITLSHEDWYRLFVAARGEPLP